MQAVWILALLSVSAYAFHVEQLNQELRVQRRLFREIQILEAERSKSVHQVNVLCEKVVVDLFHRLGLDAEATPILTGAMYERAVAVEPVGGPE